MWTAVRAVVVCCVAGCEKQVVDDGLISGQFVNGCGGFGGGVCFVLMIGARCHSLR